MVTGYGHINCHHFEHRVTDPLLFCKSCSRCLWRDLICLRIYLYGIIYVAATSEELSTTSSTVEIQFVHSGCSVLSTRNGFVRTECSAVQIRWFRLITCHSSLSSRCICLLLRLLQLLPLTFQPRPLLPLPLQTLRPISRVPHQLSLPGEAVKSIVQFD